VAMTLRSPATTTKGPGLVFGYVESASPRANVTCGLDHRIATTRLLALSVGCRR
jgi:hypothetical protein